MAHVVTFLCSVHHEYSYHTVALKCPLANILKVDTKDIGFYTKTFKRIPFVQTGLGFIHKTSLGLFVQMM